MSQHARAKRNRKQVKKLEYKGVEFVIYQLSREFLKWVKEAPEIAGCPKIEVEGKEYEGPQVIATAKSYNDLRVWLPWIVNSLSDPGDQFVRVLKRQKGQENKLFGVSSDYTLFFI